MLRRTNIMIREADTLTNDYIVTKIVTTGGERHD
jgi:hypothetical protein